MAKQIKLGFDKVPSPNAIQFVPLYDITTGIPLRDSADQIIVTQIETTFDIFYLSNNSTSIVFNQDRLSGSAPIEEQFPSESEVSSTLLGVPRAEEQLSLFSDVSTYGLDPDSWEYFTFNGSTNYPSSWFRRKNPIYGDRGTVKFVEGTNEQALYLEAFPVNYTFPFGPGWERSGRYNENLFKQYLRFIALGKAFYRFYVDSGFEFFANSNFIPEYIKIVGTDGEDIFTDVTYGNGIVTFLNEGNYYDIDYGDDEQKAFDQIERWTLAYQDILNQDLSDPIGILYSSGENSAQLDLALALNNSVDIVRPGYSSNNNYTGILQSKETFRYQPGRISGFTFGIRLRTDPRTTSNFVEFGCVNDTDHYVFQLKGSQLSIVRRSTIPFEEELLERQGLNASFQRRTFPLGGFSPTALWETVIPRDNFNGDSLDGNGPSGYILSFEDVTMYKIEFGWYGAIGAKFYAYVPVRNDEARWVLVHTLVIENGMGKPSLENPNFRFRYLLGITETSLLREPIYVYKYGASYYIDGGDEGTKKVLSASSAPKEFIDFTPNIGLFPKEFMLNQFGEKIINRKQVYPTTLSVNSSQPSRIDVIEVNGSPEGHHFHFSPSLQNSTNRLSKTVNILVSEDGSKILYDNDDLSAEDVGKKVIADGLYNVYIDEPSDGQANVLRRTQYDLQPRPLDQRVSLIDGTQVDPRARQFEATIVGNDKIVASNIPITNDIAKIHFLNPIARDFRFASRHWADFSIGFTPLKPSIQTIPIDPNDPGAGTTEALVFGEGENQKELKYGDPELISVDWSHLSELNDLNGVETGEWDPTYGIRFDLDPRLPRPEGEDSGVISGIIMTLSTIEYTVDDVVISNDEIRLYVGSGGIGSAPIIEESVIGIAEFGINGIATGITIDSAPIRDGSTEYVLISGDITQVDGYEEKIQLRRIEISDNFRVISYNENGELLFDYKNVQVFKTLQFNVKPLYLVITMKEQAQVNNIVVEEISKETTYTHTPNWIEDPRDVAAIGSAIKLSGGCNLVDAPANFVSRDRLSSVRIDTQTQQPLRPGTTIYSMFIDGDSTERVPLGNIFNVDRKTIATGLFNNKASFFTSTPLNSSLIGDSEVSLTYEEQQ